MPPVHREVTEVRRSAFLKVLRETGIARVAARAASPGSHPDHGAVSTFNSLRRRDPEFARQFAEALEDSDSKIEAEAYRRGVEGIREPVFQKGEQAVDAEGKPAFVRRYSDPLLLRLLESRMPAKWAQRKHVAHSGSIDHHVGAVAAITLADVEFLTSDQRRQLANILRTIKNRRQDDSADAIDADYVEVEPAGELPPPSDDPSDGLAGLSAEDRRELLAISR